MADFVCLTYRYSGEPMEREEMLEHFQSYEPLFFIYTKSNKESYHPVREFAVHIPEHDDVIKAASELNEMSFNGVKLQAQYSKKYVTTVYIKNIPEDKTVEDVEAMVAKYHPTKVILRVPSFNENMVDVKIGLKNEEDAEKFLKEFNGQKLNGWFLNIKRKENYKPFICFNCGGYGHKSSECVNLKKDFVDTLKGKRNRTKPRNVKNKKIVEEDDGMIDDDINNETNGDKKQKKSSKGKIRNIREDMSDDEEAQNDEFKMKKGRKKRNWSEEEDL
ncbi:hypothetical protein EIN_088120 [Entamoeba invadens IP1]|uniref:hypothetical protein n=1 Tax=Entamoeba invadens IP1 TaxID=370355 RepID=UPI0002C3D97D|nr:hypothetical protein EIN_088120 [Entamoeba invadens IP1]ELP85460.1 hypothetical protein EIN_088120 [Entamoeba invadens IP1]|eukprot:XP_004184806.1 hypothetical protein EIN_088120 [Entamoeba invadens IP1]